MRGNRDALASIRDEDLIEVFSRRLPDLLERRPDLEQTIFTAFLKTFARREEVALVLTELRAFRTRSTEPTSAVTETRSGSRRFDHRPISASTDSSSPAALDGEIRDAGTTADREFSRGQHSTQAGVLECASRFPDAGKLETMLPVSNRYRTSVMAERRPPTAPADRGSPELRENLGQRALPLHRLDDKTVVLSVEDDAER